MQFRSAHLSLSTRFSLNIYLLFCLFIFANIGGRCVTWLCLLSLVVAISAYQSKWALGSYCSVIRNRCYIWTFDKRHVRISQTKANIAKETLFTRPIRDLYFNRKLDCVSSSWKVSSRNSSRKNTTRAKFARTNWTCIENYQVNSLLLMQLFSVFDCQL